MTSVDRACEFLRIELDCAPQHYAELLEKAEAQGISRPTLYRARQRMSIITAGQFWGLPAKVSDGRPQNAET